MTVHKALSWKKEKKNATAVACVAVKIFVE